MCELRFFSFTHLKMQERDKLSSAPDNAHISCNVFWRLREEHKQAATHKHIFKFSRSLVSSFNKSTLDLLLYQETSSE